MTIEDSVRVLIFYQYFTTPNGSWSTRMYELTKRWVQEGHDVEVVTSPYEKSDIIARGFISHKTIEGIKVTVINSADSNRNSLITRAWNSMLFAVVASYFALSRKYDIVLASSGPITIGIPMILAKIFRKKKSVFEVRDLWPEGAVQLKKLRNKVLINIARWFERLCYLNADLIVAASPGMEEGVKTVAANSNTIVVPNASDIELFHIPFTMPEESIPEVEGKKIIIYAGSLGVMDECETAIKAMRFFADKPLALVIIGDGAERTRLEQIAHDTENPNIFFLGLLPKHEVAKWYSVAKASLVGFQGVSVLGTSSPNKMFDSFAAGVPIIQNTKGWISDLIETHGGGITVRCGNLHDYINAFELIVSNEEFVQKQGEHAFRMAANIFSRDLLANKYLDAMIKLYDAQVK